MIYEAELKWAGEQYQRNKAFLQKLRRQKPKELDDQFHQLHEESFRQIDCLQCANCCKTTSPLFLESDIQRLARTFKMKIPQFINTYLKVDDEGDYVLQTAPCPFLGEDNKCIVYDSRPKACREYPHTNRKRIYQITELTLKNTLICPAVSRILNRLQNSNG